VFKEVLDSKGDLMNNFKFKDKATEDGLRILGDAPAGSMSITMEFGTKGILGYLNSEGGFVSYAGGIIKPFDPVIVDCGEGATLAVLVMGAPATIVRA